MLTRRQILGAEQISNAQRDRITSTFATRDTSKAAYEAWQDTCREWHRTVLDTDYLWADETQRRIRAGDRSVIEDVLLFLEVDPWYFRSGYLKELLLDSLKQAPLTNEDKARIRKIILTVAAGKNRREFRRFCRLAARVNSDEFEEEIERLATERDHEGQGKFSYLLSYLRDSSHEGRHS